MPAVVALDQRRRHGLDAVPPRDDLGFAANSLIRPLAAYTGPAERHLAG